MNNKLVKASIAGLAALGLAATGSTFALWSDADTLTGSKSGADELALVLDEPNPANFDNMKLAPGVGGDYEFVVTNRTGVTIPTADLKMQLINLVGTEDGCTSTTSELLADPNCNDTASGGEFIDDARIIVNASAPAIDSVENTCKPSLHPRGARQGSISLRGLFNQTAATPLPLLLSGDYLAPGESICVGMGINMPDTAGNASQGDSASFDFKFLLEQVIVAAP